MEISANATDGGTISGAGTYATGQTCTLTATANEGYVFIHWTENDEVVSTETTYSFTVTSNRTLVASFGKLGDVNLDGLVNIQDVILLLRHVMGGSSLSEEALVVANVNSDGHINIQDVILLLRQIMGGN